MKLKKLKRARKALTYFRTAYGFRSPYTVFVDGTFVQAAILEKISMRDDLEKLLGGKVSVAVTEDVVSELRGLGEAFSAAAVVARRLQRISLPRLEGESLAAMIERAVAEGNPAKLLVATQDHALRRRLGLMPGVPTIHLARSAPVLDKPAARDVDGALNVAPESRALRGMGAQPRLRAPKKPRGQNPLSCKKKRRSSDPPHEQSVEEAQGPESSTPRKRRRRRRGGHADASSLGD